MRGSATALVLAVCFGVTQASYWPRNGSDWVPAPAHWGSEYFSGQSKQCSYAYANNVALFASEYVIPEASIDRTALFEYISNPENMVKSATPLTANASNFSDSTFTRTTTMTADTCVRGCFAQLPLLWGDIVPEDTPASTPQLSVNSSKFLEPMNVLLDGQKCYCLGVASIAEISEADNSTVPKADGLKAFAVPLGCLFTSQSHCSDACKWEGGCCMDGLAAKPMPEEINLDGWPREDPKEWVPAPDDGVWTGQSQECSAGYGNFLSHYVATYKKESCLNRTKMVEVLATHNILPTRVVVEDKSTRTYAFGSTADDKNPGNCARACFTQLPTQWEGGEVPPIDQAPSATPDLNGTSMLPLEAIESVWDENEGLCFCFGPHSVVDLFGCDENILPDGCKGGVECDGLVPYRLPLGCLWTSEEPCKDAPKDSCIWTVDGNSKCCWDSEGYQWKEKNNLPPVWMLAMLVVPLFFLSFLRMLARNLQVSRRNPEGDNALETELIEKHKLKYEIYLQKLLVDVNPNSTISQCSICLLDLTEAQCGKFPCGHKLHYSCMKDYIMYQIGKSKKKYPECCVCRQRVLLDDESESDVDVPERVAPGLNVVVQDPSPTRIIAERENGARDAAGQASPPAVQTPVASPPQVAADADSAVVPAGTPLEDLQEIGNEAVQLLEGDDETETARLLPDTCEVEEVDVGVEEGTQEMTVIEEEEEGEEEVQVPRVTTEDDTEPLHASESDEALSPTAEDVPMVE